MLFGVIHLAPGGPLDVYGDNPSVSPEALDQIRKAYGLDQPVPLQYLLWLKAMLTGDWGFSFRTGRRWWVRSRGALRPRCSSAASRSLSRC